MKNVLVSIGVAILASCLSGCAASPGQQPEATADDSAGTKPRWEAATEAEVAATLDRKVAEFARDYVQLKKNGVLMFCKRYRQVGSNLPTITCLTEAQLRTLAENTTEYRDRRRSAARCPHGPQGCSGQ